MKNYRIVGKIGEGAFSEVLKAQDLRTNKYVAIKCMKNHFDNVDQVNRLREIQALRRLSPHPNIIKMHEVLFDRATGRLALVCEMMDCNIYEYIKDRRQYLSEERVLHIMYQLLKSVDHMHKNGIFHRDIKPENILMQGDAVKLADYGSCRGIYAKQPFTEYISTRWYRAPEVLLTDGYYNYKMDLWGIGCVFFEILALYPLFPGENELDQIHKIHNIMGTPDESILTKFKKYGTHMDFDFPQKAGKGFVRLLPHAAPDALDLLSKLLIYNPDDRYSAKQALRHPYFKEIRQLEKAMREKEKGDTATTATDMSETLQSLPNCMPASESASAAGDTMGSQQQIPTMSQGPGEMALPAIKPSAAKSSTTTTGNVSSVAPPGHQQAGLPPLSTNAVSPLPILATNHHHAHTQIVVTNNKPPQRKPQAQAKLIPIGKR